MADFTDVPRPLAEDEIKHVVGGCVAGDICDDGGSRNGDTYLPQPT